MRRSIQLAGFRARGVRLRRDGAGESHRLGELLRRTRSLADWAISARFGGTVGVVTGLVTVLSLAAPTAAAAGPGTSVPQDRIVDASGGGDFVEIQDAIDASNPGDRLLVRPGVYQAFTCTIGLRIVPEAGEQYDLVGAPSLVSGIPDDECFEMVGARLANAQARLVILDCAGEVLIERLRLEYGNLGGPSPKIEVRDCARVFLDEIESGDGLDMKTGQPVLCFEGSSATLRQATIRIPPTPFGKHGRHAVMVSDGDLCLVDPDIQGGEGGDGYTDCFNTYTPGNGGHALVVENGRVDIIGATTHGLTGGDHGGEDSYGCGCGFPIGGSAVVLDTPSTVFVSNVQLLGGGWSQDCGFPGFDVEGDGTLLRRDGMPHLDANFNGTGSRIFFSVDSPEDAAALLVVSDQILFQDLANFLGPRFQMSLDGSLWLVRGRRMNAGDLAVWAFDSSTDPIFTGFPFLAQVALFADSGTKMLSNPVLETVGQ